MSSPEGEHAENASQHRVLAQLFAPRKIRIVKTELDLGDLVGIQDGSTFDLAGGSLEQVYDGLLPDIPSNCESFSVRRERRVPARTLSTLSQLKPSSQAPHPKTLRV